LAGTRTTDKFIALVGVAPEAGAETAAKDAGGLAVRIMGTVTRTEYLGKNG
jgi:hypothetical protein